MHPSARPMYCAEHLVRQLKEEWVPQLLQVAAEEAAAAAAADATNATSSVATEAKDGERKEEKIVITPPRPLPWYCTRVRRDGECAGMAMWGWTQPYTQSTTTKRDGGGNPWDKMDLA